MIILKFGGTSVGSPENIKRVIDIVRRAQEKESCVVVVSAFTKVTDQLILLSRAAVRKESYDDSLGLLSLRHLDAVRALIPVQAQPQLLARMKELLNELSDVLRGIVLIGECSPATHDVVVSFGERLSSLCIAHVLTSAGVESEQLDTRSVVRTDATYGNARVDLDATYGLVRAFFSTVHPLIVATGFIGSTYDGRTTTLGRGGSDYTASLFGAALSASRIEIWTDVDGVMTSDPRKVSDARIVSQMTYEEAMELSYFGAKVIYYPTMIPARDYHIPIIIKNTFNPSAPGTVISHTQNEDHPPVTAITSVSPVVLLQVKGVGLIGERGMAGRTFGALARASVNAILISQASSEYSICVAIAAADRERASDALNTEFELEMIQKRVEPVAAENESAIIAVVGECMREMPGTAGRIFSAVGNAGVNVRAIAQGSSELNISLVVPESGKDKAILAIHNEFFR
ncbi:MAG: aspartate kinase [Patescibacteria group bacterium]